MWADRLPWVVVAFHVVVFDVVADESTEFGMGSDMAIKWGPSFVALGFVVVVETVIECIELLAAAIQYGNSHLALNLITIQTFLAIS